MTLENTRVGLKIIEFRREGKAFLFQTNCYNIHDIGTKMGEAKSRGWVGRVCLKIKKDIYLAPSVVAPNLS